MSDLAQALRSGDRRALARAITLVENGDPAGASVLSEVFPQTGDAAVVGVTGPPGVGKSTLLDALIGQVRGEGHPVGLLAVDPSSPLSSGALLGDRVRLDRHFLDPGVFIRSMATRGAVGGLTRATLQALLLLDAAGFDPVMIETVGVGQVEVDVAGLADVLVLCLMPGAGDLVQALKSGIMEVPDILVVTRGDDEAAESTLREVREALRLRHGDAHPPVLKVDAVSGTGVAALWELVSSLRAAITDDERLSRRRAVLRKTVLSLVVAGLGERVEALLDDASGVGLILDEVTARIVDPVAAAQQILEGLHLVQVEPSNDGGWSDASS